MNKLEFKKKYCKSEKARLRMNKDFIVSVNIFEELMAGEIVKSYATGEKNIEGGCIIFSVIEKDNTKEFNPVFSETVGRILIKNWGLSFPKKFSLFENDSNTKVENSASSDSSKNSKSNINVDELSMLVLLTHKLINYNNCGSRELKGPLKDIFEKIQVQNYFLKTSHIKGINPIIKKNLLNFKNLNEFIEVLKNNNPNIKIKKIKFENLRVKLKNEISESEIFF